MKTKKIMVQFHLMLKISLSLLFNFGAVSAVHQTPKISVSQLSLVQLVQLMQFQVQFRCS